MSLMELINEFIYRFIIFLKEIYMIDVLKFRRFLLNMLENRNLCTLKYDEIRFIKVGRNSGKR